MANLNLSGFKKLKEDKKTVTMGHPSGHKITILKSKIPALQRKQLDSLPLHLADGGDTETDSDSSAPAGAPTLADVQSAPPVSADVSQAIAGPSAVQATPVDSDSGATPSADQSYGASSPLTPRQMAVSADEISSQAAPGNGEMHISAKGNAAPSMGGVNVEGAYAQGQKAIDEQRDVAAQLAQKQADVQQNDIDARKELQFNAQQNAKDFQEHQKQILNDYMNGHINPNHYQENMSTGQKVATAIGLLIGGFTGGFNKTGVNPAADWLNGQITRDIEAQRSRMDQQKTLLGANQELYHDSLLANNATRMNMNDIYDHQIQQQANLLGTAAAKAAADAQHSKLGLENANLLQQNAIRGAALQTIRSGGAGLDPLTLGQAGFMSPEDAKKEQGAFDSHKLAVDRINTLFEQANKEQTTLNLVNPQSYKRINAINAQLTDAFLGQDVNHRYSKEAADALLAPNLIKTTDDEATRTLKQTNILQKARAEAIGGMPILAKYAPQSLPSYNVLNEDDKAIQWAKANPKDPRAGKILQSAGGR